MKRWFGAVGIATLLAGPASAQSAETGGATASDQTEAGAPADAKTRARAALLRLCEADAERLCAESAGSGGDKLVVACLVQYKDQLEPGCVSALKRARRVQAFRRHCGSEVKKLCPGVEPGEGRVVACLKENEAQVSQPCKDRWARRRARKSGEEVASVADEAITEEQAGAESVEEELAPLPEETPVAPATGEATDGAAPANPPAGR